MLFVAIMSAVAAIFVAPWLEFSWYNAIFSVLGFSAIIVAFDFGIAIILRLVPFHLYAPPFIPFRPFKNERKFWRKTGIRKWKVIVPDLMKTLKVFDKTNLKHTDDPDYMFKFLCEMGYAEMMHILSAIAGFAVLFVPIGWAVRGAVYIGSPDEVVLSLAQAAVFAVPLAVFNFVLNILPIFVQRYNRPVVLKLYQRAKALEEMKKADGTYEKKKNIDL
ncbi:MAG: hypothetical protein FWC11_01270 [Firmicutes bacterium]|nr:hypothetical protein [Bacillota bacterium]